jgi:hypothetical protein
MIGRAIFGEGPLLAQSGHWAVADATDMDALINQKRAGLTIKLTARRDRVPTWSTS